MKTLKKIYYKLTVGKDYEKILATRKAIRGAILSATNGGVSSQYNAQGEKIRGVFKKSIRFSCEPIHPLIQRYKV